ncbi:Uncharacterised protein [Mycobacteroides abscessus subsp. massiliense]|nr:Uncharacterised protein [Mycobacteroides abscessus subsp. massiliense]
MTADTSEAMKVSWSPNATKSGQPMRATTISSGLSCAITAMAYAPWKRAVAARTASNSLPPFWVYS